MSFYFCLRLLSLKGHQTIMPFEKKNTNAYFVNYFVLFIMVINKQIQCMQSYCL